jgi:hypothetical protein
MKLFSNTEDKHIYISLWVINSSQPNPMPNFPMTQIYSPANLFMY